MIKDFCIYGASGHGKVIIEILECSGRIIKALYDDDLRKNILLGYPVHHERDILHLPKVDWVIGIGRNEIRKKISELHLLNYANAIDPSANISKRIELGKGMVIMPGATINSSTRIGNHCIINSNASIDHDCFLGDFVHVSPNATLCGGVRIGDGTQIGAGATIIPGITIGSWATVGAGAAILKDVADYATVVGNPGKII